MLLGMLDEFSLFWRIDVAPATILVLCSARVTGRRSHMLRVQEVTQLLTNECVLSEWAPLSCIIIVRRRENVINNIIVVRRAS